MKEKRYKNFESILQNEDKSPFYRVALITTALILQL